MRKPAIKSKPAPVRTPASETVRPRIPVWLLAVLLMLVTIALYWPATSHDFVNYDDNLVVTSNVHVQNGLTLENLKWAFFNPVNSIWHPLTVMSHMLDSQLFGLKPWGHHLMNVLFHALNAALVFGLLRQLSGAVWRSLLVAALFAVHPLHVESVAWVAERKDVLSGFFGLLSLIFYVRYAQRRSRVESRESNARSSNLALDFRHWALDYCLALFFFALGLMSKPMLVTWPFVMLLLDYWPLRRFELSTLNSSARHSDLSRQSAAAAEATAGQLSTIWRLVREKIPFFALAVATSIVTFVVQKQTGALAVGETIPLGARVGNALVSYCRYLGKLFWPTDLAVFYPHSGYWPLEQVLLAGGLILGITALFIVKRGRYPFLLMGWLWFCGTLVPVIGLVQVGGQAMADRYTYIPSLGVLILTIWGAYELTRPWQHRMIMLSVAGGAAIVLCLGLTRQQLGYWQDSETLFRHALAVTENNYLAYNNLGVALDKQDQTDEAIRQYQEAIRLKPGYAEAHNNLGVVLDKQDQTDEAIRQYQEAIRLEPDYANAHNNLGFALDQKGQIDEAISQYQEAIRLKPDHARAHNNLGLALAAKGRFDEAIENFRQAIQINPNDAEALNNLGVALAAQGQFDEAVETFRKAIQINSNRPETFFHLGMTLGQLGRPREAVAQYREALRLNPNLVGALNNLAWVLAASPDDELRNGAEAVRLAEHACELTHYGQPMFIGTLAAAYAECGRFPEAVTTAEKAEKLATDAGLKKLAGKNRQLLELYRAGKPYHEPALTGQK
jgi:tetratricopeptide (TPR) repeat protein